MANGPLIDAALKAELSGLYAQPGRHYHGLSHIEALLALLDRHRALFHDPQAAEAAIWFHDAIYDSRRGDNEARSAALAAERLAGRTAAGRVARIVAMIEATATHALPDMADGDALGDAALFLDMDLAVLGASPEAFAGYEAAVRREYGWVDGPAWARGRAAVLEKFLARPRIFHTETFGRRYEAQARLNLARSLAALAKPPADAAPGRPGPAA